MQVRWCRQRLRWWDLWSALFSRLKGGRVDHQKWTDCLIRVHGFSVGCSSLQGMASPCPVTAAIRIAMATIFRMSSKCTVTHFPVSSCYPKNVSGLRGVSASVRQRALETTSSRAERVQPRHDRRVLTRVLSSSIGPNGCRIFRSEVRAEDASRQKVTASAGPGKIGAPSGVLHCTFEEDPSHTHVRTLTCRLVCVGRRTQTSRTHKSDPRNGDLHEAA